MKDVTRKILHGFLALAFVLSTVLPMVAYAMPMNASHTTMTRCQDGQCAHPAGTAPAKAMSATCAMMVCTTTIALPQSNVETQAITIAKISYTMRLKAAPPGVDKSPGTHPPRAATLS